MTQTETPEAGQVGRWENDGGRIRAPGDAARHARADHVDRQLVAVADRLCREFAPAGGPAATSIRDQVRRARAGYGSPRVIDYLPVLVERAVRGGLNSGSTSARQSPRGPGPVTAGR